MFEIKAKEALGRIGKIYTKSGVIETPYFFPVVNPNLEVIPVKDFKKEFKVEGLITNSYIIWRNPETRDLALKKGIHEFLRFKGVVMTDSGAFQLYSYGDIEVSNEEIVKFQERIGSDVAVILDVPVFDERMKVLKGIKETVSRAEELKKIKLAKDVLWVGPIHGSIYPDLVKYSCKEMSKFDFDIYAIGTVVPSLENYDFHQILDCQVIPAKRNLPINKPVHLFGAGHPIFFAFAVAFGCDLFDSASYALYAKAHRYMTMQGTRKLEELPYLPCSCPVCSKYTVNELLELPEEKKVRRVAEHNLWVILQEIKTIKVAIKEGNLLNLIQERARIHPKLLYCLNLFKKYKRYIEKYDPVAKERMFIYSGRESLHRPEVYRAKKRIKERVSTLHVVQFPPFGQVPSALTETYPFNLAFKPEEGEAKIRREEGRNLTEKGKLRDVEKIKAIIDYQYGRGVGGKVFGGNIFIEKSKRTGRIRRVYDGNTLLGTLVPGKGLFVLKGDGVKRLFQALPKGKYSVIVQEEAIPFLRKNRSLFAKFIIECDDEIRAGDEVLLLNKKNKLIGYGKTLLNCEEMKKFTRGVAVKVREVFSEEEGKNE